MKNKQKAFFVFVVLLLLVACNQPASQTPILPDVGSENQSSTNAPTSQSKTSQTYIIPQPALVTVSLKPITPPSDLLS